MNNLYARKPIRIKAIQFVDNADEIAKISALCGETMCIDYKSDPIVLEVDTENGVLVAEINDYVLKDENGELTVMQQGDFEDLYQPIGDPTKFNLDSEMLAMFREHVSQELHAMARQALKNDRDAEITIKIDIKTLKKADFKQMMLVDEWNEFEFKYKLDSKLKEIKGSHKHQLGDGYEVFENENGNISAVALKKKPILSVVDDPRDESEEGDETENEDGPESVETVDQMEQAALPISAI